MDFPSKVMRGSSGFSNEEMARLYRKIVKIQLSGGFVSWRWLFFFFLGIAAQSSSVLTFPLVDFVPTVAAQSLSFGVWNKGD